jgi:hypothetical protein
LQRPVTKSVIEYHFVTTADFSIENRALRNPGLGHFLQTQSLGAQLDPIAIVQFRFASLEFNRTDSPIPNQAQEARGVGGIGHLFNLNYIQPTVQP